MIVLDLMLITLLIVTIILLSGIKIMFNTKYLQLIITIFIIYTPISELIEGYKLGYIGIYIIILFIIIILLIVIWGYRRNKYIYSIHNVKGEDVITIIEKYLDRKNIKYEVVNEEIYLTEIYKAIYVGDLMAINLDCREIKGMDFYNDMVNEVRFEIKKLKKRYFSMEGIFYLILILFFYWIKVTFLK